jgi:hypothetical protein
MGGFLVLDAVIDSVLTETSNLHDEKMLGIAIQQNRFRSLFTKLYDAINNNKVGRIYVD